MGHVIVLANHKGGVGKTTGVANIGAALASRGDRVLLIDADPQANLGETFGLDDETVPGLRLEDVLAESSWEQPPQIWRTRRDPNTEEDVPLAGGVHLLPCTEALADVVASLTTEVDAEYRLSNVAQMLAADYEWILIDTPPGLGALSTMAMLAADAVIAPARPADYDIGGAVKVADLIEGPIAEWNPKVRLLGVLVGQVDKRWHLAHDTRSALHAADIASLDAQIPFAVRVGSAPRHMAPTFVLEPDSRVSRAYGRVADHLRATFEAVPA